MRRWTGFGVGVAALIASMVWIANRDAPLPEPLEAEAIRDAPPPQGEPTREVPPRDDPGGEPPNGPVPRRQ